MEDMIIKGSGNSRWLKSVANVMTLYPTYESFIEALAAGTFPIDLNGINPAGVETLGTRLSKANLLTDATATAMGLTAAATPDQALDKLRQIASAAQASAVESAKIATGSYTGTGKSGSSNQVSLLFNFSPNLVLVGESLASSLCVFMRPIKGHAFYDSGKDYMSDQYTATLTTEWGTNKVSWHTATNNNGASVQFNKYEATYWYVAIS